MVGSFSPDDGFGHNFCFIFNLGCVQCSGASAQRTRFWSENRIRCSGCEPGQCRRLRGSRIRP